MNTASCLPRHTQNVPRTESHFTARVHWNPRHSYPDRIWRIKSSCQLTLASPLRLFFFNSVRAVLFSPYWSQSSLTPDRSIMLNLKTNVNRNCFMKLCSVSSDVVWSAVTAFFKLMKTKSWDLWAVWAKRESAFFNCASLSEACLSDLYPCPGSTITVTSSWTR